MFLERIHSIFIVDCASKNNKQRDYILVFFRDDSLQILVVVVFIRCNTTLLSRFQQSTEQFNAPSLSFVGKQTRLQLMNSVCRGPNPGTRRYEMCRRTGIRTSRIVDRKSDTRRPFSPSSASVTPHDRLPRARTSARQRTITGQRINPFEVTSVYRYSSGKSLDSIAPPGERVYEMCPPRALVVLCVSLARVSRISERLSRDRKSARETRHTRSVLEKAFRKRSRLCDLRKV